MKNHFRYLKDSHFSRNGYVLARDGTLKIRHGVGVDDRMDWHAEEPSAAEAIANAKQHRQYTFMMLDAEYEVKKNIARQLLEDHLDHGSKEDAFCAINGLMPSSGFGVRRVEGDDEATYDTQRLILIAKHAEAPMGYLVVEVQHRLSNADKKMHLSLTVDEIYVAPSYRDKAVGIDLFIACGWLCEALTRATFASLESGWSLSTSVEYEQSCELDIVCLDILEVAVEGCLECIRDGENQKGITLAKLEVIEAF